MVYHRLKHDPSDRFASFVDDLRTFIETEDVDELERAVGIAAEKAHRERFKAQYGVDAKSGGRPCIARLWDEECRHTSLTAELPHQPPHADHASLWLADGTPAVYTMHLYELPGQHVRDIAAFAAEYELQFRIEPYSLYFPGQTTLVTFSPPEVNDAENREETAN